MSRSVWKGRTVACTRVCIPNELAVPGRARFGTGIVVPETGNRAYRKGACLVRDLQRSNSKDRSRYCVALYRLLGSFVLIIIVRTSRFHLLSSFPPIFSFFYLRFFQRDASKTNEDARGAFYLGKHARTHARHLCAQHAPPVYVVRICTRVLRRSTASANLNATNQWTRPGFCHFFHRIAPRPASLRAHALSPTWIVRFPEEFSVWASLVWWTRGGRTFGDLHLACKADCSAFFERI